MDEEYYERNIGDWDGPDGNQDDYVEGENDGKVQEDCLQKFSSRDYIMEPAAGGSPERVIQLLSENYSAVAQTVNLLAEWLFQMGVDPAQVQERVENHLKSLLTKHFDPQKADSIFTVEGEDLIASPYTSDFVQLFLPILENDSVAGTIRTEGEHDPVAEFIAH